MATGRVICLNGLIEAFAIASFPRSASALGAPANPAAPISIGQLPPDIWYNLLEPVAAAGLTAVITAAVAAWVIARSIGATSPFGDHTRSANLLKKIAIAANEAATADQAMQTCLDEVCAYNGWPVGHVYMLAEDGSGELVPTKLWHLDQPERFEAFRRVTQATRFKPGIGLPGRVLQSGEPAWIVDVTKDPNFPRAEVAQDNGVKAGMGFPVLVGHTVVAVMEIFSNRSLKPDDRILEVMAIVGTQLGRVIERERAEEALLKSERTLRARVSDLEEAKQRLEQQRRDLSRLADDLRIARNEADAANQAKSQFLATMSHELRTPLNAIIGFSDIIANERIASADSAKCRDYARDINESGQHLLELINDILDLSKVELGTDELHEEEVQVSDLVDAVRRLVVQRAEQQGITFAVHVAENPPLLWADKRRMKQVLVNLLANAIKCTDAGGKVTLTASETAQGGFIFEVADTGIGMAPGDIPTALSRFGQIDRDLDWKYEGTGLGLPLSKSLMERHGGTLELTSELGVGTTIIVSLPADRVRLPSASQKLDQSSNKLVNR